MLSKYSKFAMAAAVAGACGYASANTLTVSATGTLLGAPYSVEGAANTTTTPAGEGYVIPAVDLSLTSNLSNFNHIRFTLSGSATFQSVAANSISYACTGDVTLAPDFSASKSGTASFLVTNVSGGTAGTVCSFVSLSVAGSSLTTAGDKLLGGGIYETNGTNAAVLNNGSFSAASTGSTKVLSAASQIASIEVLSALNGVVDFQDSLGYGFATDDGGDLAGNSDILSVRVNGTDTTNSLTTALSLTFSLGAEAGKSFAWLSAACPAATELNASGSTGRVDNAGTSATFTINPACTSISVTDSIVVANGGSDTASIEFASSQAQPSVGITIEPMTFPTFVASVTQGATARAQSGALTPGSWTSNGSVVQIPYMPINTTAGASKIDPVIIISNRSNAIGTITATVRDEDGNTCAISDSVLGTISGGRTKSIGGAIRDAIAGSTCSTLGSVEKVSVTLTVTLPSGSTEVYSGYTVGGGDRVTVVNSSNGR